MNSSALKREINDTNKCDAAGFAGTESMSGRERVSVAAISSGSRGAAGSFNGGVVAVSHVRGGGMIPLALFALAAIYKRATTALLILGTLRGRAIAGCRIGLFQHDLGKFAAPLFIAVLQFFVVYLLHRSVRITPQTNGG